MLVESEQSSCDVRGEGKGEKKGRGPGQNDLVICRIGDERKSALHNWAPLFVIFRHILSEDEASAHYS
jgi:hypothetical protein